MSDLQELKKHPFWELRENYINSLNEIDDSIYDDIDENDTITLYHGTTTSYLNSILSKGILPRQTTGNSNWDLMSVEKFTYLTNKWHYYYAYRANEEYIIKQYGEDYVENPEGRWWENFKSLPCYIECKVPKKLLFADEDMILSNYFFKKLKALSKKSKSVGEDKVEFDINWEESLAQYGTVAVYGGIPAKYIHSFTVLGEVGMYLDLHDEEKSYLKDFKKWQSGKGKGKRFDMMQMLEREARSDLNGTWWLKDLKGRMIKEFGINPVTKKITLR